MADIISIFSIQRLLLFQTRLKILAKTKNIPLKNIAKMAEGQGCNVCKIEHDGNFYRFCKCSCHDKIARTIAG
ncbi:MAG: hypothetical protein HKM23_05875 [Nitrosopumilus sp.]|nr:hypothetical protein [Nitrosopumilus sp.]